MKNNQRLRKIQQGLHKAVADALARHKLLGESIAIWKDGKVVIVPAHEIQLPDQKIK